MTAVTLVVALAIIWTVATGGFTLPNLLLGALVAAIAAVFLRHRIESTGSARRLGRILALAWLFVYELANSALRVAALVVSPNLKRHMAPAIIAYPLTVTSDAQITLLASLVTLTPGTLSVDVSEDRRSLFIHVLEMHDREAIVTSIRDGFEARIIEVFQS